MDFAQVPRVHNLIEGFLRNGFLEMRYITKPDLRSEKADPAATH